MAADTSLSDALEQIKTTLAAVTPAAGFTFDLSVGTRSDLGRFLQPPKVPVGPPFVRIAELEELPFEQAPQGKNVRRIADYLVVGWVKGEDFTAPLGGDGTNSGPNRMLAASRLRDDIHSALLADRRMKRVGTTPLASNVSLRGAYFDGNVNNTKRDYAVVVYIIRVFFAWKAA